MSFMYVIFLIRVVFEEPLLDARQGQRDKHTLMHLQSP